MPRVLDKFWQYITPLEGVVGSSTKNKCNLCGKEFVGGITRFKAHISKLPNKDVDACPNSSPDLALEAARALESVGDKRSRRQALQAELGVGLGSPSTSVASGSATTARPSSSGIGISSYFEPRTTPGAQPSITSILKKNEKKHADLMIAKLIYYEGCAITITNNPFWQPAFDAACAVGPGYKAPTLAEMKGTLIRDLKQECTDRLADIKESWKRTGCTILSDGWTDRKGRTLINFVVYSKQGTIFMKSIDASAQSKDHNLLCDLLDQFVQEVGVEHVVQLVTDNAANYVLAGKKLMERYPSIVWTPCACHCIDLLLEDIGKLDWVKEVDEGARSITKFIYNHSTILSMMRGFTNKKELARPGVTRFASHFISLQSLKRCMHELRAMFISREWNASPMSKRPEGMAVASLIGRQVFWDRLKEICSVIAPIVRVLRLVDGDRPTMGYLYEAMDRAKEAIKRYYEEHPNEDNEYGDKYTIFWDLIDARWHNMLHRDIHGAGAILNPSLLFAPGSNYITDHEANMGATKCISTMVIDPIIRARVLMDLEKYKNSLGFFGYGAAKESRFLLPPEMWWTHFGGETPELQRLAIRILSQTCSASGCERNWSAFEKIHSKKRNRMTTQRLHDTVYVYVNLRLYVKQLEHKDNHDYEPINLSTIDPTFSDVPSCDVEEEQEDPVNQEFRAAWIDLEEDIDRMANIGVDLDQEEEEVEEEDDVLGDAVHFEDPLPPVDFGVGPLEQIDPDAETLPADDSPSQPTQPLSYARLRPRIRGSAFGLAPQARYARATSRAPSPSTPTSRAPGRGIGSGVGGRLTNKRAR